MDLPPGVTREEYAKALLNPTSVTTKIEVLTDEHDVIEEITSTSLTGQVNWLDPRSNEVTRTMTLDVYDPTHELNMDSNSPKAGVVYADRFLRATVIVDAPNLSGPARVKCFTGPSIKFARNGAVVSLEAQGKEQRARTDFPHLVCKKRMYVVDAFEKIMRHTGETKFDLPGDPNEWGKLNKDIVVGREEHIWPWAVVQRLADANGVQAFYNGPGRFVVRESPEGHALHEFIPTGPVSKSHDWSEVYNRVEVRFSRKRKAGKKTKTKKDDTFHGRSVMDLGDLKGKHPFAPGRMGRNDVPWTRTLLVDDDKIHTRAQAHKVALQKLRHMAVQHLDLSATVVPAWHLDPLDPFLLDDDRSLFRTASAPLGEGQMTLGYVENVRRPHR